MSDTQYGRIASRPRWRATPRAMLRCLGLSALIACAGCGDNTMASQNASGLPLVFHQMMPLNTGPHTGFFVDEITGCQYIVLTTGDARGGVTVTPRLDRDGRPFCGAIDASGTETRQGGDGTAPSRSDDGPTRNAGDARDQ